MPYAQDLDTGEWVEVDAQGNPVAAAPANAGRVFTLPMSGKEAAKEAREAKKDARDEEGDALRAKIAQAELALKQQQLEKGQTAGGNRGTAIDKAGARRAAVEALTKQMLDVDAQLRDNFEGEGDRGWEEYLPTPTNRAFDAAAAGMSDQALGAFRVPGVGAQSDAELRAYVRANELGASEYDTVNRQRFNNVRNRVDETRKSLGLAPVDWENAADQRAESETDPAKLAATGFATDPNSPPPDNSPPGLPPANAPGGQDTAPLQSVASGQTRFVANERANAMVNSMMSAGASKGMIDAMLAKDGLPSIRTQDYVAAKAWMAKNPGQRYNASRLGENVPMSMMERAAGSTLGAGAANYADAATAGISTALAGDRGRGALDAMNATSPNASAVGSVMGGITGAGAAELAAARALAPGLARFAPRLGDAAYGGTQGVTSADEGDGLTGAALGAGAGVLGGAVGERAMRGLGSAFRGVQSPTVQRLRDEGVELTVGQAVGDSGRLGEFVKGIEDRMTGLPIVGDMVNARRMEGLEGFNQAAFRRAAAPGADITATGAQGMGQVRQSVGDAYSSALDPVTIDASDPALIADLDIARVAANALPDEGPLNPQQSALTALRYRMNNAVDPATDTMSGRGFQEAYRGMGRTSRTWNPVTHDYANEVQGVMRQGQDALGEALERQNPGAFTGFLEANAANRRANVLADALRNSANQGDELFTPAQLNRADVGSTSRLEGRINSAAGNRPFYDLATAGQSVLPSRVPDSGTAGRLMTGLALSGVAGAGGGAGYALGGGEGAATGTGAGLGAALALALGGSRGAQNVATRMLLDRPAVAITVGEELRRRAALGGVGGAGILAQIVAGQ